MKLKGNSNNCEETKQFEVTPNDKKSHSLTAATSRSHLHTVNEILEDIFLAFIVCKLSGNGVEMSEM